MRGRLGAGRDTWLGGFGTYSMYLRMYVCMMCTMCEHQRRAVITALGF